MPSPRRTSRRGTLKHGHLRAHEVHGGSPVLRGRIAVQRGSGVIEFPNVQQFRQIAREEGVPKERVDQAFGHLERKLTPNSGHRVIRRGQLQADETLRGEPSVFVAREIALPDEEVTRFGATHGVYVDIDGEARVLHPADAMKRARKWFSPGQFKQAFGHLESSLVGATPEQKKMPTMYGPRTMRLGHWLKDELHTGIGKHSLVLFHKPTSSIVWQAIDVSSSSPEKPILVKFGAKSRTMDFGKALSDAQEHNIPPLAFLEAFGSLLTPESRRDAYRMFSPR